MFKIKVTKKPKTGSQADYGLITNSTFVPSVSDREKVKQTMGSLTEEDIRNGKRPTIEVEGGEEVIGDIAKKGVLQKFRFKGPSHAEGGMPVDIPQGSFVYSKKLKMKDPEAQEAFGMKPKKEGYSFSDVAKKYDINTFVNTLEDSEADPFAKRTAQLMLQKNTETLARLADKQEETKGYPGGRPEVAKQVLGVPDVPAQVEDLPQSQQAENGGVIKNFSKPVSAEYMQYGGNLYKAQFGGDDDGTVEEKLKTFAQQNLAQLATTPVIMKANDLKNLGIEGVKEFFSSNKSSKSVDEPEPVPVVDANSEAFRKANFSKEFLSNPIYSAVANEYKKAFDSKDYKKMKAVADQIEKNRNVTEGFFNADFMDMFPATDSDKFSDMASVLRSNAEKGKAKNYVAKTTDLHSRAYKNYKNLLKEPNVDMERVIKAKKYAEKMYKFKKAAELAYSANSQNYNHSDGFDIDFKQDDVSIFSDNPILTKKALEYIDKHSNVGNKVKPKTILPIKEDHRTNSQYDEDLKPIDSSPQIVIEKKPVIQKKVQQVQPVQPVSHPVWNLDDLAYGGEMLNKYEGTNNPSTVSAQQPIEETIVGKKTGETYKSITYPDGSTKLFKSDGTLHSEKPAGSVNYDNVLKAKNTPAVVTPSGTGKFSQYGSSAIQKYLASQPNAVYTKFEKGAFGTQPRMGNTGIYLSSKDLASHKAGNLSEEEWKDFDDRHGDWVDKEYTGGKAQFRKDLETGAGSIVGGGHQASEWFQDKVNEKSNAVGAGDYFTKGSSNDPYHKDKKFGHVTYSVPRFWDLKKPEVQPVVTTPETPVVSKDEFVEKPGEPLEEMPPKTPGWYLQDMVNFGAALGQKTADFRPMKGSVNASMTGYTLEDPTTAQNTLQANQGRVQDQIENTTAGNVGTAVAIDAAAENAANAARIASENEGKNTGITNQAFDKNAAIQNQQNMVNQEMMQKFVGQSADFGNAKIKEQNMKNAQIAEMFNKGTEHEFKRKQFEQVLYPQTAMNPVTGDWYTGGKGRDIFGPDTYSPAYGSQNGKLKNYEDFGKDYDQSLKHFTEKGYANPEKMAQEYANKRVKQDDDYSLQNKQLMMQAMMKLIFGGSI